MLALVLLSLLLPQRARPAPAPAVQAPTAPSLVATWKGHSGEVHALAVSPDGTLAVSAGDDMTVRVWRIASGKPQAVLRGHKDKVWAAQFLPNGKQILSAGFDGLLKLWDVERGVEAASFGSGNDVEGVSCLAITADGQRAVTGGFDAVVRYWDLNQRTQLAAWRGHSDTVWSVAFAAEGQRVASASFDASLRVWDVKSGECTSTWTEAEPEQRGWKRVVVRAPEGRSVLFGGSLSPREWNLETGVLMEPFVGQHTASVVSLSLSADGRSMVTGGFDGHLHLWDRTTRTSIARWPAGQGDGVWAVAFLPDGRLLSAGHSGAVHVWRTNRTKD